MEEAPPAPAPAPPPPPAGSETATNQTIYINNLNEKIKLDGIISDGSIENFAFWWVSVLFGGLILVSSKTYGDRIEEIAARGVFAVRENTGGIGLQNPKA